MGFYAIQGQWRKQSGWSDLIKTNNGGEGASSMCVSTNFSRSLTLHTSYTGTAVNPTSEVSGYETLHENPGK